MSMAIVRNVQNNTYYRYLGENRYRNLITGVEGEVTEDQAKRIFKISAEMTYLCENFPNVEELINRLKLKKDENTTNSGS